MDVTAVATKPHAVCIPLPAQSHIKAMLKFAKLLHHRGFHITFVNSKYNHRRFLKSWGPNSLDGLPDFQFKAIPDGLPDSDADTTQDVPLLCDSVRKQNFLAPFRELLMKLNGDAISTSTNPPVTCIVSDGFMSPFTITAAEEIEVPLVLFYTIAACSFMGVIQFRALVEKGLAPLKVRKEVEINNGDCSIAAHLESEERGGDLSYVLVSPKDANSCQKSYLQEVLKMYIRELPAMNFAANTGKQSMFLKRSVTNGKYCTLFYKSQSVADSEGVIAAISYQIVPADTQYAEIPLAAVSFNYQRKGFGSSLFMELRKRLQSVGICTIFCWGDKESEGFWFKQGFVPIAEVDAKGRRCRLPIKADIRKALCFPGGSTLMVLHLNQDVSGNTSDSLKLGVSLKPNGNSSAALGNQVLEFSRGNRNTLNAKYQTSSRSENYQPEALVNDGLPREDNQSVGYGSWEKLQRYRDSVPLTRVDPSMLGSGAELSNIGTDADETCLPCSKQPSCAKRKVWEASTSSLKSKKVKGCHLVGFQSESNCSLVPETDGSDSCLKGCSLVSSKCKSLVADHPRDLLASSHKENIAEECGLINITSETLVRKEFQSQPEFFKIMLMNIADNRKKANLTKVIEDLGGVITSDGSTSTHVVTGKVRTTLNFCTALCSGAWMVCPSWLKESFRQGRFVDESSYILNDQEYVLKYGTELRSAVLRAKASPQGLFKGYNVCISACVQPPARMLSSIVRSAGGNIIGELEKVNEASKTIFVACEEDMEKVSSAVEKGIWTFSGDWLMNCVMRQELDLEAPQFAESL